MVGKGRTACTSEASAIGRTAGHTFARAGTVASTTDYVRSVSIAADAGGQVTLAWGKEHFGDDHSIGTNGVTSVVLAATATAGEPFRAPRTVAAGGRLTRAAGRDGRARARGDVMGGFEAIATTSACRPSRAGRVRSAPRSARPVLRRAVLRRPAASVPTLARTGVATVVYVASVGKSPAVPVVRLLAADGS